MKEKTELITDERIAGYSIVLSNALRRERYIKKALQSGAKATYIGVAGRGVFLKIDDDLLWMARRVAFGAYNELAFNREVDEETGEEKRVINPDGKAIADAIILNVQKEGSIKRYKWKVFYPHLN